MIRSFTPIDDEELRAQLVRLRRAGDLGRGRYAVIPEDRAGMLRRLREWSRLLNGALWTDDSWESGEQHHVVITQVDDVLARAGKSRPGVGRKRKEIRELAPRLVLTGVPDGWLHLVYELVRELAGSYAGGEERVAHGRLRAVRADAWSRLTVDAELIDWTGARAVAVARIEAQRTCELCGGRGATMRLLSWAGMVRACSRHEP